MNFYFIFISVILFVYLLHLIIENKIDIYESFFWIIGSLGGIFFSIFPKSIDGIAHFLGIDYPPALFFLFCILFLFVINFRMTRLIAKEKEKLMFLAQEVAILKEKIR